MGYDSRCTAARPHGTYPSLDWVAKKTLFDGYRRRDRIDFGDSRLDLIDLQYSDVDPQRGLWARLEQRGRLRRLTTDEQVTRAVTHAPENTGRTSVGSAFAGIPNM